MVVDFVVKFGDYKGPKYPKYQNNENSLIILCVTLRVYNSVRSKGPGGRPMYLPVIKFLDVDMSIVHHKIQDTER